MEQSGHVRRFLLVAADVRHEVEFLEAFQDNAAADEQAHICIFLNSCTSTRSTQSFMTVYDQAS